MTSASSTVSENPSVPPGRVQISPPRRRHVEGLVRLSHAFAEQSSWASTIPMGQITTETVASSKLFGRDVIAARVAETASGSVVG